MRCLKTIYIQTLAALLLFSGIGQLWYAFKLIENQIPPTFQTEKKKDGEDNSIVSEAAFFNNNAGLLADQEQESKKRAEKSRYLELSNWANIDYIFASRISAFFNDELSEKNSQIIGIAVLTVYNFIPRSRAP